MAQEKKLANAKMMNKSGSPSGLRVHDLIISSFSTQHFFVPIG